ncbi:MAG: DUF3810 family protein, partial [Candidatus Eremiobacteraeota bacterium]|nr:DUF3810 family protein [Candidatus Eremiobacteraeota bacterium]
MQSRKEPPASGSFFFSPWVIIEVMLILLAVQMFVMHPTADWVEVKFINGYYPVLERTLAGATSLVALPVGDAIGILGAVLILWRGIVWWRRPAGKRLSWARFMIEAAAIGALYSVGFYAMWAWCYERAPLTDRVAAFDQTRVNAAAVSNLTVEAIAQLNRLAPIAHRSGHRNPDLRPVAADVQTVAQRLGNTGDLLFPDPKQSLIDWYLSATGIAGYINPYSAEDIEASDVLWFERPDFTAHEWAHTAGFAREDEANYIAVIACLRSKDPVIQYSGWQQVFLYLPQPHITRTTFVKEVWEDFGAMTARNKAHINVSLSAIQWRFYNNYLKANN